MKPEVLHVTPVEGQPLVVYRVVASPDRNSVEFQRSFWSNHDRGAPVRHGSTEARFGLIRRGISCFRTRRQAERVARRWSLGNYVAELRLRPDAGICVAEWGSRGHLTVWADPVNLSDMAVDIRRVTEER